MERAGGEGTLAIKDQLKEQPILTQKHTFGTNFPAQQCFQENNCKITINIYNNKLHKYI